MVGEGHFSLAGAQRKTALRYEPHLKQWGVPKGTEPTDNILKPNIDQFENQVWNEGYYLRLDQALDLPAAHSCIIDVCGHHVLVVERFDRLKHEGLVLRVHQEGMCQALGLHPDRKYQKDGGPTRTYIVRLLDNSSAAAEDQHTFVL
jgi:serine/threonine-protein kinase HipA